MNVREFCGTTEDLSLGGAWVRPEQALAPGLLVQVTAQLDEQEVRFLALVARDAGEDGVGLEFLDYVGGARYYLHGFLERSAA